MIHSIYIHVPFCARKCVYCAFYSEDANREWMARYVNALTKEIRSHADLARPDTIFFGGGTPSLLTLEHWKNIFDALYDAGWTSVNEFTIECNPATLSYEKAALFREKGVNRISMGVQSLDETLLHRLGRIHSRKSVFESFHMLRQTGFDNINLDLMFAIPGQTQSIWKETLKQALDLGSEHLSCYEVIYEQDTPLFDQLQSGKLYVDDALSERMYETLIHTLEQGGFQQYEIANFARQSNNANSNDAKDSYDINYIPQFASLHNINYWIGGEYLGLGPAASGHIDGLRYQNCASTELYCQAIERDASPREGGERLNALSKASEIAAFWLRMNCGIDLRSFALRTGFDFRTIWQVESNFLIAKGWAEYDEKCFRLTRKGLRFADAAAAELLKSDI